MSGARRNVSWTWGIGLACLLSLALSVRADAAVIHVTTLNPTGPNSLGDAITTSNADSNSHDEIRIDVSGTIKPTGSGFGIAGDTEIIGPGARQLTIDGQGARRGFQINLNKPVTISGLTVANGLVNADPCSGAGIDNENFGTLTLKNVALLNNTVSCTTSALGVLGGAVYSRGPLVIEGSTIAGNQAAGGVNVSFLAGGGVGTDGSLTIRNSTITGNSSSGGTSGGVAGGAVTFGPTTNVLSSTVAGNSAGGAGANLWFAGGGSVTMRGTVIANPLGSPFSCLSSQGAVVLENNFDSNGTCSTTGQAQGDPQLGALADNGGPTDTMLPSPASPLIDGGVSNGLSTDQRGSTRTLDNPGIENGTGDGTDIGAVEAAVPVGDVTLDKPKVNKSKGTATVNVTVSAAGQVALSGDAVKGTSLAVDGPGGVVLDIKASGKVKKALKKKGKATAPFSVTFTPASGTPDSADGTAKLKKKKKKKK